MSARSAIDIDLSILIDIELADEPHCEITANRHAQKGIKCSNSVSHRLVMSCAGSRLCCEAYSRWALAKTREWRDLLCCDCNKKVSDCWQVIPI